MPDALSGMAGRRAQPRRPGGAGAGGDPFASGRLCCLPGGSGHGRRRGPPRPRGDAAGGPHGPAGHGPAVRRVRRALETGETVAVYGDYDVDGITSTCLLTDCLSRMGGRILPYIPDRLEEGYGLNAEAVSALAAQGVTLIVTVDCGITAGAETAFAASLGVDVVVTDHHECKENLPPACAVVDPRPHRLPLPLQGTGRGGGGPEAGHGGGRDRSGRSGSFWSMPTWPQLEQWPM